MYICHHNPIKVRGFHQIENGDIFIQAKIVISFFKPKMVTSSLKQKNEPRLEITNNVVCGTSKASDLPAQMRSLIRAFASPLNIL